MEPQNRQLQNNLFNTLVVIGTIKQIKEAAYCGSLNSKYASMVIDAVEGRKRMYLWILIQDTKI